MYLLGDLAHSGFVTTSSIETEILQTHTRSYVQTIAADRRLLLSRAPRTRFDQTPAAQVAVRSSFLSACHSLTGVWCNSWGMAMSTLSHLMSKCATRVVRQDRQDEASLRSFHPPENISVYAQSYRVTASETALGWLSPKRKPNERID